MQSYKIECSRDSGVNEVKVSIQKGLELAAVVNSTKPRLELKFKNLCYSINFPLKKSKISHNLFYQTKTIIFKTPND